MATFLVRTDVGHRQRKKIIEVWSVMPLIDNENKFDARAISRERMLRHTRGNIIEILFTLQPYLNNWIIRRQINGMQPIFCLFKQQWQNEAE